jgi:general secretion pathway protein D
MLMAGFAFWNGVATAQTDEPERLPRPDRVQLVQAQPGEAPIAEEHVDPAMAENVQIDQGAVDPNALEQGVAPEEPEGVVAEEAQPVEPGLPAAESPPPPPAGDQRVRPPRRGMAVPSPRGPQGAPPTQQEAAKPLAPGELPVNEARPKNGAELTEPVKFDFDNADLSNVIQSLGPMTGKNFDIDPTVATQKVTIITHTPIPPDMVYEVLESILAMRGLQMVPAAGGNLIRIRPVGEDSEQSLLHTGEHQTAEGFDSYSMHIIKVRHADATELATVLKVLGSKQAQVDAYGKTNTLILYDNAAGIRKMLEFLKEVDVPGYDEVVEFFTLEFTRAEVISEQIQQVLMGSETGGAPGAQGVQNPMIRQPAAIQRPPTRGAVPGQRQQTIVGSNPLTLRIVPDERLNALVVVASQPLMDQVRDLIERLDSPTPSESNTIRARQLLHADAEAVETALAALTGSAPRQSSSPGGQPGGSPGGAMAAQSAASMGGASGDVQPFEKRVTITRYDETNSLLIIASPQDYKVLDALIAQLDVPARQVHVEAIIMEVGITDNFQLAVESAGLTANDYFALNNVVNLANVLTQGPLSLTGSSDSSLFNFGVIDGTTSIRTTDSAGVTTEQIVPNVPFLMTALEALTALDVLSRPSLTTVDNEEAKITVGQKVPFIRNSQQSLGGNIGGVGSVYNSVDREEVGIKLTVTPQISEGDYVNMKLDVEVSSTVASDVGLDPNLVGPTLSLSQVTNKVVIKDSSTGIVGGLISETTERSNRQTPLLGDVPGLGWLFRRKDNGRQKRNLVVLVTPHIVKSGIDFDRFTEAQMDEVTKANMDEFFEKGLIKKIKKKHYLRNEYRPTETVMPKLKGQDNFERGEAPEGQR